MVVMAMMMVMGAQEEGEEVTCQAIPTAGAPLADAAALVQQLRVRPGLCCPTGSEVCSLVETVGNSLATLCGSWSPCPSCADVSNNLNKVLSQCNRNSSVQGEYDPDDSDRQLFLTSNTLHP